MDDVAAERAARVPTSGPGCRRSPWSAATRPGRARFGRRRTARGRLGARHLTGQARPFRVVFDDRGRPTLCYAPANATGRERVSVIGPPCLIWSRPTGRHGYRPPAARPRRISPRVSSQTHTVLHPERPGRRRSRTGPHTRNRPRGLSTAAMRGPAGMAGTSGCPTWCWQAAIRRSCAARTPPVRSSP